MLSTHAPLNAYTSSDCCGQERTGALGPKPPVNKTTTKVPLIHCPLASSSNRAVQVSGAGLLASYSLLSWCLPGLAEILYLCF